MRFDGNVELIESVQIFMSNKWLTKLQIVSMYIETNFWLLLLLSLLSAILSATIFNVFECEGNLTLISHTHQY